MKTKHKFWKLLSAILLYSLLTHWQDAKKGWNDATNESQALHQNQYK